MTKAIDPGPRIAALKKGPHKGVAVRNAQDGSKTAEMYLYDVIGDGFFFGVSAADFVRQLQELDDDVEQIELHINSPGGDAFDGIAILNALRAHDAKVVCIVDGLAASAASFIAVGADEVVMARNSELMIHDAWGLVIGNAQDMHDMGDVLDKLSDNIASIYAEQAGSDTEEWRDAMRTETWYTADEAVDAGLADKVAAKKKSGKGDDAAKDRFDLSIFTYRGRAEAPAPPLPSAPTLPGSRPAAHSRPRPRPGHKSEERSSDVKFTDEQLVSLRNKLGLAEDADETAIVAALDEAPDDEPNVPDTDPDDESEEDDTSSENSPEVPEGMALIDSDVLAGLQEQAQAGHEARTQQLEERRDREIDAAIRAGKTTPARRDYWKASWKADPEGTSQMLAKLAEGMVPVEEVGHAGGGEDNTSADVRESTEYKNWSFA